ncbi:hypothetical protein AUJ30_00515 [Candidatus Wolfebacteria bacterium CG1_02_39_135]|uniref:Uncharacterized protein n=1 Tax=Candidatus Wolfebacteria bacterium CG1_02_39_135 TaxID=1805425 RepID=A0A1J4Y263_9BACT|nr:hypothetical protein [Parcubacteria group bacterium]NCP58360.1 hypothetical protein [Candidatus Wolfebacteria bacterium]OIO65769.1 MAG: hypothetical protein AUJ30_00515 [Candidatus Wolfebacteria bacterium CG1_02_39_135]
MYNFILQIAIMLSLGTMIYLMARAVPRVADEISKPETKFDGWLNRLRLEKFDVLLGNFLEKLLRKIKLFLMKLDNVTNNYLDKVKQTKLNGNGQKNKEEKPNLFNSNHKEEEGDTQN